MIRVLQVMGGMNRRGAETFIMNVYRKVDRSLVQFDFLVYTEDKQDFEDEIVSLGGRIIHKSCPNGIWGYKSIYMIREVIHQYGPYKAIHAQTLYNISYALLAAKSYPEIIRISHSHNTQNTLSAGFLQRVYEKNASKIIRKYTQVMMACGEEAGKFLFGEKFSDEGIVLKNGIDLDTHTRKNKKACCLIIDQFGLKDNLVIGSVARFNGVKNHQFMVYIAKVLKSRRIPFKMVFVGNGDLLPQIQQLVKENELEDDIIFAGIRTDINDLMHVFDVFLMPSHFEGNPVTLVEAQAAGLPCVITDVITDKMNMDLDLIYKCSLTDSPEHWADTIIEVSSKKCVDEQKIRKQIAACGYDVQDTADQLLNIYLK